MRLHVMGENTEALPKARATAATAPASTAPRPRK